MPLSRPLRLNWNPQTPRRNATLKVCRFEKTKMIGYQQDGTQELTPSTGVERGLRGVVGTKIR
jgi:hypothetical protein